MPVRIKKNVNPITVRPGIHDIFLPYFKAASIVYKSKNTPIQPKNKCPANLFQKKKIKKLFN